MKRIIIGVVLLVLVVSAGYFTYDYLKKKPPAFLISLLTHRKAPQPLPTGITAPLVVPNGFSATIFSRDVPGARVMIRDPKGTLLVSETLGGKVVALPDTDSDGRADRVVEILTGLDKPHGLFIRCTNTESATAADACTLYVAETGALKTYQYNSDTYVATLIATVAEFPTGSGHYTRTVQSDPDGKHLLISIGSDCNVCTQQDLRRATVQSLDLESNTMTTFATGLRNSVFMAVNPLDGKVWATENGRDVIGDDIPPDELNQLQKGGDYGFPFCYGQNVRDTDFNNKQYAQSPCANKIPAAFELPAHVAALGLSFIPEEGWPEDWWGDLLVSEHGSWNRSTPSGYKIVRVNFDSAGNPVGKETIDVVTGFLPANSSDTDNAIGRPVGVLAEPGGVFYISDDRAGAIFRVALNEPAR